jgi:hypothetical protein
VVGEFDEARRHADRHDEAASQLSAHHRVHAVAMRLEVHELAGGWVHMAELGLRTRSAVAENQATPCVRNSRSLLSVAVGSSAWTNLDPQSSSRQRRMRC